MKISVLLYLIMIIPVAVAGLSLQPVINPLSGGAGNSVTSSCLPGPGQLSNRNWRLDAVEFQSDDATPGTLLSEEMKFYFYNDLLTSRIDSIQVKHYDSTAEDWVYDYTRKFTYDGSGEYVTDVSYYTYNNPIPFVILNYYYNPQHRLIDAYQYIYSWTEQNYFLAQRTNFAYNANSISQILMINPGTNRSYYEKYTFDQDASLRNTVIYGTASPDSINFGRLTREYITYHANDSSTGSDYIYFISHKMMFEDNWKGLLGMISIYDLLTDWDGFGWQNTDRDTYTYNTSNQVTEVLRQHLNMTFQNDYRFVYTYDANDNLSNFTGMDWNGISSVWYPPEEKTIYSWGQFTANEDDTHIPATISLKAYPNPFSSLLHISIDNKSNEPLQTAVYNLKGQLIKKLITNSQNAVWNGEDESGRLVSNGIYFIRADSNCKLAIRKVIRLK